MNRPIIILLLSAFLMASCNNASQSGDDTGALGLFPIVANPENPSSIFLRLVDKTEGDTSFAYLVQGLYQNDTVGLIIEVDKDIPAGINPNGSVNEEAGFKKGAIKFKKSGTESDRFIAALAELWLADEVNNMSAQPVQPLAFSSNKKPVNHSKPSTSSFKLFFEEDSPTPGELFFTLDTYKRIVEFQEKGTQYRSAIVYAFAE